MELYVKRAHKEISAEDLANKPLSAIDWVNDKETLSAWNALHSPKIGKVRYFTFVQKSNTDSIIDKVMACPKWAYIKHDKDITSDGIHYHFYVEFPNPRSFCSVANDLGIPVVSLQKVLNKRGILEYLTHKNEPNKHHYDDDEVCTNMIVQEEIKASDRIDPWELYCDYKDLREGRLNAESFYKKYQIYIVRHSFSNQLRVAETVYNVESADLVKKRPFNSTNGGTCPPFRVP